LGADFSRGNGTGVSGRPRHRRRFRRNQAIKALAKIITAATTIPTATPRVFGVPLLLDWPAGVGEEPSGVGEEPALDKRTPDVAEPLVEAATTEDCVRLVSPTIIW
jgi:hypothetical protein